MHRNSHIPHWGYTTVGYGTWKQLYGSFRPLGQAEFAFGLVALSFDTRRGSNSGGLEGPLFQAV